jgi:tetratricopeptide (TPR) repeat protein
VIKNQLHFLAMYNLAVLYFRAHKFTAANKWFTKVTELNPNLPTAFWGQSLACFKLGNYAKAEKAIEQGVKAVRVKLDIETGFAHKNRLIQL